MAAAVSSRARGQLHAVPSAGPDDDALEEALSALGDFIELAISKASVGGELGFPGFWEGEGGGRTHVWRRLHSVNLQVDTKISIFPKNCPRSPVKDGECWSPFVLAGRVTTLASASRIRGSVSV